MHRERSTMSNRPHSTSRTRPRTPRARQPDAAIANVDWLTRTAHDEPTSRRSAHAIAERSRLDTDTTDRERREHLLTTITLRIATNA
jgi:hypothetical protein